MPTTTLPPSVTPQQRIEAPRLAVLPFSNESDLTEGDILAFGMVEDMVAALSQGTAPFTPGGEAAAQLHTIAIPNVGGMEPPSGTCYLLEGAVVGNRASLRVTLRLVDAAQGTTLWTESFVRPLAELSALQTELVLAVAARLEARVSEIEIRRVLRKPDDLSAWVSAMHSLSAFHRSDGESLVRAIAEARNALQIAPDFGFAHALFASPAAIVYHYFSPDDPAEVRGIKNHVERALALDPDNARVLSHAAFALAMLSQPEAACRHAERAVRLGPGTGFAHFVLGSVCCMLNRFDEALEHFANELRLSPRSPWRYVTFGWMAVAHACAGRWREAMPFIDESLALEPGYLYGLAMKAIVCRREGRSSAANQAITTLLRIEPQISFNDWETRFSRLIGRCPAHVDMLHQLRMAWAEGNPGR